MLFWQQRFPDISQKCKSISVKENIDILKGFNKSSPKRLKIDLAKMMDIQISTLKTIIPDRQKIGEQAKD